MNLSGDIGRKSGFSYESKRYFAIGGTRVGFHPRSCFIGSDVAMSLLFHCGFEVTLRTKQPARTGSLQRGDAFKYEHGTLAQIRKGR